METPERGDNDFFVLFSPKDDDAPMLLSEALLQIRLSARRENRRETNPVGHKLLAAMQDQDSGNYAIR